MALPKDFAEALDTHLELAGKLLDQASVFKERIDDLERQQEKVNFEHKMGKFAVRDRYANAMFCLSQSQNSNEFVKNLRHTINGIPVPDDSKAMCVVHTPMEWCVIWHRVYIKVHKYLKQIRLQYHYGRNPAQITTSKPLKVVVNKD